MPFHHVLLILLAASIMAIAKECPRILLNDNEELPNITSITTNYTEEFRYAGKNSRGSNQASLSGNLPPLENVSAICENYWIGERNQSTSLGGHSQALSRNAGFNSSWEWTTADGTWTNSVHFPSRDLSTTMKLTIDINGQIVYEVAANELECEKVRDEEGNKVWSCIGKPGCT